jgi:hypothetical protein
MKALQITALIVAIVTAFLLGYNQLDALLHRRNADRIAAECLAFGLYESIWIDGEGYCLKTATLPVYASGALIGQESYVVGVTPAKLEDK